MSTSLLLVLACLLMAISLLNTPGHASPSTSQLRCRCLPSQPCWPNAASWSALNQTVGGRLIATRPVTYECHDPHFNNAACLRIQHSDNNDWRLLQPSALQVPNWEQDGGKGCLGFNKSTPCHQGAVPLYAVKATTIVHVQETIKFAAKHNIRLVVKNTGHDFLGRSSGASSLSLWVFNNKDISFDDKFVPIGANEDTNGTTAIILGTGVVWKDVYKAADKHKVVVPGTTSTIGATGGYCQGGGHSPISTTYGLCADNVLQYKVVVADGSVKIANAHQNMALFWALRGGGGGTFGVVVEAVYRTFPAMDGINMALWELSFYGSVPKSTIFKQWLSLQANLTERGWSGTSFFSDKSLSLQFFQPNSNKDRVSIDHFLMNINSIPGIFALGSVQHFPTFWSAFQVYNPHDYHGIENLLVASRLLPREKFETSDGIEELTDVLLKAQDRIRGEGNPTAEIIMHTVAGGVVADGNDDETSVHPAWRKALATIGTFTTWHGDQPLEKQQAYSRNLTSAVQLWRDITPGSGTYFNEGDVNEPDWQENFFGTNYPFLKKIKRMVDPHGLFVCRKCVGSEDWSEDFNCPVSAT
ncbi:hypothetical protein BGZ67_000114 [Mortierella alpina]|nr:hypothetical protein BGZ67_000114 [Mortierella alpina]